MWFEAWRRWHHVSDLWCDNVKVCQLIFSLFLYLSFSFLSEFKYSYIVRPSPFSAQKTFERHNSRRKSNISFCSNINLAAAASAAPGSRRGSGIAINSQIPSGYPSPRAPPLVTQQKSNSLSLPDSPSTAGQARGRSNSLRVRWTLFISIFPRENKHEHAYCYLNN